jgi:hypothetical protein
MNCSDFQKWLQEHGQALVVDGLCGPKTRAALTGAFTNSCAQSVTDDEIATFAARLGCSVKQIMAVALVESSASGFDRLGRPKILFERHLFWRYTRGIFGKTPYSDDRGGGYDIDSWQKLELAACKDVDSAFASCSWGKFQVLGAHWRALSYPSPLEMAYSAVTGEAAHYEMLCRYVEVNGLTGALKRLSMNPHDNAEFARKYNGPAFEQFAYHTKLASAMAA